MENIGEPTLVQAVRAHTSEVTCLDAAGAGARLVSGGGDRVLRVWQWTHGTGWAEEAKAVRAHRFGITCVRWSPGGCLAASCGVDGAARVWSRGLRARRLLAAPAAPAARALCWPGPQTLLTGYDDGSVCLWDVRSGKLLSQLAAHENAVHALATPGRGALLLAASTDAVLKVYDLQEVCRSGIGGVSPAPLFWLDGVHDLGVLCADASEDGAHAATGGHDSRIRLWNIKGRIFEAGATLEGHTAAITCLRWSRAVLASAALDRTARIWTHAGCLRVLLAHARYLTCVALAPDLRFMITGSNDKSIRMWSLGSFTIDDDIDVECSGLAHFGLGDLEGIGPVEDDYLEAELVTVDDVSGNACRVWYSKEDHAGSVNGIATHEDLVATASSDGLVRIFRWCDDDGTLRLEHELGERRYPVMTVHFGSNGALLMSAGLDGEAVLWDVQSGCRLRSLCAPATAEGEAGGGGVRAGRVSPHTPPLLLLATDDGLAHVWSLAIDDPAPLHTYGGYTGAVVCCAWSHDGRALCGGSEGGELRVSAPPPLAADLFYDSSAHDLGVQSCDFTPTAADLPDNTYLLVTAGNDLLAKIWNVKYCEDLTGTHAAVSLIKQLSAHTGAVSVARWSWAGSALVTGGADSWARVWQRADTDVTCCLALPSGAKVPAVGGVVAASFLNLPDKQLLALGTLAGELILWKLSDVEDNEDEDGLDVRFWGEAGVARWVQDYITRVPGFVVSKEIEIALLERVRESSITGARLLDDPIQKVLENFGYSEEIEPREEKSDHDLIRERLVEELGWMRRAPLPGDVAARAPHRLRCPLSHRVLREPARAADGFSYERTALHEWFISSESPVSPISGRRLQNARVLPNYRLREELKEFYRQHQPG